jgi:hypothetical protein
MFLVLSLDNAKDADGLHYYGHCFFAHVLVVIVCIADIIVQGNIVAMQVVQEA